MYRLGAQAIKCCCFLQCRRFRFHTMAGSGSCSAVGMSKIPQRIPPWGGVRGFAASPRRAHHGNHCALQDPRSRERGDRPAQGRPCVHGPAASGPHRCPVSHRRRADRADRGAWAPFGADVISSKRPAARVWDQLRGDVSHLHRGPSIPHRGLVTFTFRLISGSCATAFRPGWP